MTSPSLGGSDPCVRLVLAKTQPVLSAALLVPGPRFLARSFPQPILRSSAPGRCLLGLMPVGVRAASLKVLGTAAHKGSEMKWVWIESVNI